ncbi:MFS transporter [Klebsiella pneumoniae]
MKEIALPLHPAPARVWIAVVALGICAFSIVTSELAPVGMLSALAADFHQTESGVGLAVTAYGWVGALAALLSGAMPARISRKALLVGLMLILALSCLAATRSYSMFALMSARMIGALAHGAFWALIGIVAAQLVPPHRLGLATAIIFGGVSAASVVGGAAGELYRHPGGLATRVYVDGPVVTSRRCGAVLDAAPRWPPLPPSGCVFFAISSAIRCSVACMAPRPASLPLTLPPSPTLNRC